MQSFNTVKFILNKLINYFLILIFSLKFLINYIYENSFFCLFNSLFGYRNFKDMLKNRMINTGLQ